MRWVPNAMQAMIVAIALYFIALWSFEGLWALTAPLYGLGDLSRSRAVYSIGRLFALSPADMMRVAAFIATLKLAVAVVFSIHIFQRVRALFSRKLDYEILEAGLLLAALLIVLTVVAPIFGGDGTLVRSNAVHLPLLAVAAMLVAIERLAVPSEKLPRRATHIMPAQAETVPAAGVAQVLPLSRKIAPSFMRMVQTRKHDSPAES